MNQGRLTAAIEKPASCGSNLRSSVKLQQPWLEIEQRLSILRRARHLLADQSLLLAETVSPLLARSISDTLVTEVLPLLDASKFLERNAASILRPRRLGNRGQPLWLSGVDAEIHYRPLGHVLIIAPYNFPLFLPGSQTLHALAAGNTVTWKPGVDGYRIASLFANILLDAGLPSGVLTVLDESVEAAKHAISLGVDKVVFTGSSANGRALLSSLSKTITPAILELSGADAVIVMPEADLQLAANAIAFGLSLNGGAVCMSPRRLFATKTTMKNIRPLIVDTLAKIRPVSLTDNTASQLRLLLDEAVRAGAQLLGIFEPNSQMPLIIDGATPDIDIAKSDIFAPVISLIEVESILDIPRAYGMCPYALTVSVFCGKSETSRARSLSTMLKAGTILINDLIAPTADPRIPFGGQGASGYGLTRGPEGLLAMASVRVMLVRKRGVRRYLKAPTDADAPFFAALISALHGDSWAKRTRSLTNALLSLWNRR